MEPLPDQKELDPSTIAFYLASLDVMKKAGVPCLVGGAYAFACYTGITRHTKDFDLFIRERDLKAALEAFEREGYRTEITLSSWLAKAYCEDAFVDIIFSSGNGVADVDDVWFENAVEDCVFGTEARLCPVEEIIWQKAFVMERERYDGADIAHLIRARGDHLDWRRLIDRFGDYWRVLFSHLVLFGFIYPTNRDAIPMWVVEELTGRLIAEVSAAPDDDKVCRGTLISRAQYLTDIEEWGYRDARLKPEGGMTRREVADWTAQIED